MKQVDIFLAFFRVGILGFGGGPSSIPLVHKEVVERYKWINSDDFSDILALGNALPGPIITKMSGYIGYRVGGVFGMMNAILASILPTIVLMILLLTALNAYKDRPWVSGMSKAVVPVVGVMLATLTWDFVKKSSQSKLGWGWTIGFIVVSTILLQVIGLHPAIIIFALLFSALIYKKKKASTASIKKVQSK